MEPYRADHRNGDGRVRCLMATEGKGKPQDAGNLKVFHYLEECSLSFWYGR